MRLVEKVPDNTMFVSGYEHHTLECLGCGERERRLAFRHAGEPWAEEAQTQSPHEDEEAPSIEAASVAATESRAGFTSHSAVPAEPQRPPRAGGAGLWGYTRAPR